MAPDSRLETYLRRVDGEKERQGSGSFLVLFPTERAEYIESLDDNHYNKLGARARKVCAAQMAHCRNGRCPWHTARQGSPRPSPGHTPPLGPSRPHRAQACRHDRAEASYLFPKEWPSGEHSSCFSGPCRSMTPGLPCLLSWVLTAPISPSRPLAIPADSATRVSTHVSRSSLWLVTAGHGLSPSIRFQSCQTVDTALVRGTD